jgi:hypothetical protein
MIDALTSFLIRRRNRLRLPPCEKDWRIGDLAQCIASGSKWRGFADDRKCAGPDRGAVCRVIEVVADDGTIWLVLDGWWGILFPAGHFRKLRPSDGRFARMLRKALAPKAKELAK